MELKSFRIWYILGIDCFFGENMKIYYSIDDYARKEAGASVALGYFDGVHAGHRTVIGAARDNKNGSQAVVFTFGESPAAALGLPVPPRLTDNERKAELFAGLGADAVIFADFRSIKDMSPEEFVRVVLKEKLGAKKVFCGYNYRFGKNGAGDTEALGKLCGGRGIEVGVVEPVYLDGETVSSSRIRELIAAGDIKKAELMLGRRFAVKGVVRGGNRIGAQLGFPTVNIPLKKGMVAPRFGVYSSVITIDGKGYKGATNIGVHPTVGENSEPLCETFIIGYEGGELYSKEAVVELCSFVRPERKFASAVELKEQVLEDIEIVKSEECYLVNG